jgi:hypothetical protein
VDGHEYCGLPPCTHQRHGGIGSARKQAAARATKDPVSRITATPIGFVALQFFLV